MSPRHIDQLNRLRGVDVRLSAIILRAAVLYYCASGGSSKIRITEGLRSYSRQQTLIKEGKSWTSNSHHLYGRAVDVAIFHDGELTWEFERYRDFWEHVEIAASEFGEHVTWGGDWSQRDGVHFQLELLSLAANKNG